MLFYMFLVLFIFLILLILLYFLKKYENFNIRLEKAHGFYIDYRNFIDGNDKLLTKNNRETRLFPYKISPSCFSDKFSKCKIKRQDCNDKISNNICEDQSLNQCILPVMMSQ
jgi:hypothetical protein